MVWVKMENVAYVVFLGKCIRMGYKVFQCMRNCQVKVRMVDGMG